LKSQSPVKKQKPPREIALKILAQWQGGQSGTLDELLDPALESARQPGNPAWWPGWLQEVCSGVVRWRGRLDGVIDDLALTKKPTGNIRRYLWIGIYQLLVMSAPVGAVVDETVETVKKLEGLPQSRFVNALLRKVASHLEDYRSWPEPSASLSKEGSQALEAEARWASVPVWWWKRLVRAYGREFAKAFCVAGLERPTLWVRECPGTTLKIEGGATGPIPGSFAISEGVRVGSLPGIAEGKILVQDLSSQCLVAEVSKVLASRGTRVSPLKASTTSQGPLSGFQVLDLCAAPGGKSVGLSWNGAEVTATDASLMRLQRLRENTERLAPQIKVLAREEISNTQKFDLIWVDAPCTGNGILRRHPDVRWSKTEADLEALLKIQGQLLREAADFVKPDGLLMYSVCSLLFEEGQEQAEHFCKQNKWKMIEKWTLGPHLQGGDGFFGALLERA
jgi:16S rRNA (cytosine967-C5)-methyltransferase